jgi:homoserine O-acetyltransferase/O-succinyltransferase
LDGIMPVECFPVPISGRNLLWRKMLIDGIRSDPLWENGNYQKQPPSAMQGSLLARMMIDGVPALQHEVPNPEAADALIHGVKGQAGAGDANDLLYAFESSRDFNAEPRLDQIKTKVYALNFADDEFYRDSLQVLQHDSKLLAQAKIAVRPISQWPIRTFGRPCQCLYELARHELKLNESSNRNATMNVFYR